MEEDAKEEDTEKAVTAANSQDEEVENKKKEDGEEAKEERRADGESCHEGEKKAEGAEKKNEAKEKSDDEKGPATAKKEVVEKDMREGEESPKSQTAKEQRDKEPAKKAPISSFFGEGRICIARCLQEKKENMSFAFISWERWQSIAPPFFLPFIYLFFLFLNSSQESCSEDGESGEEWRREEDKCREEEFSRGE